MSQFPLSGIALFCNPVFPRPREEVGGGGGGGMKPIMDYRFYQNKWSITSLQPALAAIAKVQSLHKSRDNSSKILNSKRSVLNNRKVNYHLRLCAPLDDGNVFTNQSHLRPATHQLLVRTKA